MTPRAPFNELRDAAARGDWDGCRSASAAALTRLSWGQARPLVLRALRDRRPVFQALHPQIAWPGPWLAGATVQPDWEVEPEGPGGGNFIQALESLAAAENHPEQWVEDAVEAVAGAIMTEVIVVGAAAYPERWRRWYRAAQLGQVTDDLEPIVYHPDAQAAARRGWLAWAESLAQVQ